MSRLCAYAKEKDMPLEFNLLGFMSGRHYPNESFWKIARNIKTRPSSALMPIALMPF